MKLLVERIDGEDENCGLSAESLRLALAKPVLDIGLKVEETSPFTLYVDTSTMLLANALRQLSRVEFVHFH